MKLAHIAAVAALAAGVAVPATAAARDDDDVAAHDPAAPVVVYEADGGVVAGATKAGTRSFVADLVARGALGGSFTFATSDGRVSDTTRVGIARPTVQRYRRLARPAGGRAGALGATSAARTVVDGRIVTERGYAVDLASGRIRRVSLSAARTLSADPRGGTPNTEYVYFRNVKPVGAGE